MANLGTVAMRLIRIGLAPLLLLAAMLALATPVLAHGADGTRQLDGVPVGPFTLTVWTFPATLRVGEIHLSAAVLRPTDGAPVMNCTVIFQISPLEQSGEILDEASLVVEAGAANATTRFLHEAILTLDTTGRYHVDVRVINPAGELEGTAAFEVTVQTESLFFKWLVIGLILFTTVVTVWFVREGQIVWAHRNLIGKETVTVPAVTARSVRKPDLP